MKALSIGKQGAQAEDQQESLEKEGRRKQSLLTSELDFNEDEALEMLNNYHNENLKMM